eukprot:gene4527-7905_t
MKLHEANAWDSTAKDYEATATPITFHFASTSIEQSGAKSDIENKKDLKILDIGAATGELGLEVSRISKLNNSKLKFFTTDFSSGMIKIATEKAKEFPDKIECLVMDGAKLEFKDEEFDYIFSMFAFFLFPERKKSINEMYRVLKVGGKVALSLWTYNEFGAACFGTVKRSGLSMGDFNFKPLKDKETLVQEMTDAGFKDIQLIDDENVTLHDVNDIDKFITEAISNPMYQQMLNGKSDDEVKNFVEKFKEELLEKYVSEDGKSLKFVTKALIGIGSK